MTPIKIRKLLITSGAYKTPFSTSINKLYRDGKTVNEIQKIMGLSAASVNAYLPYQNSDFYTSRYVGNLCSDKRDRSIIEIDH